MVEALFFGQFDATLQTSSIHSFTPCQQLAAENLPHHVTTPNIILLCRMRTRQASQQTSDCSKPTIEKTRQVYEIQTDVYTSQTAGSCFLSSLR